ncbi:MAG: hypothetical protein AAB975_02635 [Patescibacteria group bacterium]
MNLTQKQKDIMVGTLLGDGYLSSKSKDPHLELKQSDEKKEYVFWLYKELENLCTSAPKQRKDNNQWYVNTHCSSELMHLRYWFYPEGVKIVPRNIEKILVNPLSLAIWYMDDGTLDYREKDHYAFRLTTHSFTPNDNQRLVSVLNNNFEVDATVQSILIRGKRYPRIHIGVMGRDQFYNLVQPYILNCFKHKLPPLYLTPQRLGHL